MAHHLLHLRSPTLRLIPPIMRHNPFLNLQHPPHIAISLVGVHRPKQHVHALEGPALRLLEEEEHKHAVRETEDPEHDEGAVADVVDGRGRDFRDAEVEEPLRRSGHADSVAPEAVGEDFADVYPGSLNCQQGVEDGVGKTYRSPRR